MNWLKKAWHYVLLIFKKTTLDNVILDYFIKELLNNQEALNNIVKNTKFTRQQIIQLLMEMQGTYNLYF